MKGIIFEIKRFAVHDGEGIRTTVFLKGCSLKCVWCHNPEGLIPDPQLGYFAHKCVGCGACVNSCLNGAHTVENREHVFNRNRCTLCGRCEETCPNNALKLYGKPMSVDELLPLLMEDRDYYINSGGGVTLSGGECMLQIEFCTELCQRLKMLNINTAIDTCGNVPFSYFEKIIPYTDTLLYDIQAIDEDVHKLCTGSSNRLILENLKKLDKYHTKIEIRIPLIPGYNQNQVEKIAVFLSTLKHVSVVKVLPYHNFASSKYDALGLPNTLPPDMPSEEELLAARKILSMYNLPVV